MLTVTILVCSDSNDYINNINEEHVVTAKLNSIISHYCLINLTVSNSSNNDRWFITRVVVIVDNFK